VTPRPPDALVLAAGLGTRFHPLNAVRAKPAAPVAGRPLIARILEGLSRRGVTGVVINLSHRPGTIARAVGDGRSHGVRVRYSWESSVLGSAGGPRHALPLLTTDPFLIVNGDTLSDVDLAALVTAHAKAGADVTMAVIPNPAPDRYGGVLVEDDGTVTGFTGRGDRRPSFHFIGVQVARCRVFAPLQDGVRAESVNDLYRTLIANRPGSVTAFVADTAFLDIGTPADYLATCLRLAGSDERREEALRGVRTTVAADAVVERSVLWDDVRIGARCRIEDCVIADSVAVPDGWHLTGCAVVNRPVEPPHPGELDAGALRLTPMDGVFAPPRID
jgi:NDP-sugar pyrophosphorylase family protein